MDRLKQIEDIIAELEKKYDAENARELRVSEAAAKLYEQREKDGVSPIVALLEKVGLEATEIEQFFKAREAEAKKEAEVALDQVRDLHPNELELIDREARAIFLINPCLMVGHQSPDWKCSFHAVSCNSQVFKSKNQLNEASCVCNTSLNKLHPLIKVYGQGSKGKRNAWVKSWCNFDIPARTKPTTVHVDTLVAVHGSYSLQTSMTTPSKLSLDLRMEGFQYNTSWANANDSVLDLSGDLTGRIDSVRALQFEMPVDAAPFQVRVKATLKASVKGGGSYSVADFATGSSNYLRIYYINTCSIP